MTLCIRLTITCLLLSVCISSFAVPAKYNVLFIHSYDTQHQWTNLISKGFEAEIAASSRDDIIVFNEYMDAKRFPRSEYQDQFYQYLLEKYENHTIDVVVTSDDPALNLLFRHPKSTFNDAPIIFMGVNLVTEELLSRKGITGVFENRDLESTMIGLKDTFKTDDLIVIGDESSTGMSNLEKINRALKNPLVPSNTRVISQIKLSDINTSFADLSPNTPILLVGQLLDDANNNQLMNWTDGVELLNNMVDNPIATIAINTLEYGASAAHELDGQQHAAQAAGLLLRLVDGEKVDEISKITRQTSTWYFNWQKMKQYGLSKDELPKNAQLLFEDISFYEAHRGIIIVFSIVFAIALVIIGLLAEIVRRSRAEQRILKDNKTRYQDLALEGANLFWETNENGIISYISGDVQHILGVSAAPSDKISVKQLLEQIQLSEFEWSKYNAFIRDCSSIKPLVAKYKKADQSICVISISAKARFDRNNEFIGHRGIIKEITGEYSLTKKIAYEASHDSLTGLYNRRVFNERFKEVVATIDDNKLHVYICYLDLDNFKAVNDSIGHLAGDGMLADITNILSTNIPTDAILARLGGDEFGLILNVSNLDDAMVLCERLIKKVKQYKLCWNSNYYSVGLSIGMVQVSNHETYEELLSYADIACYKAKETDRGTVYYSSSSDTDLFDEKTNLGYIANIDYALDNHQFFFAKQLIQPLTPSNAPAHYELLLRYTDINGKSVPPSLFIPTAEKYGVITLIDKWVIRHAVMHYHDLFDGETALISINVSGISISTQGFLDEVKKILASATFDVSYLCFEITETAVVSHISKAVDFITQLKPFGCKFALDDFGSGSSSYGYLKQLPVDYLKIDGSLIQSIEHEFIDHAIVKSITEIAHKMNIKTVAEYIENDRTMEILKEIGLDYGQGYFIHKPQICASSIKTPS